MPRPSTETGEACSSSAPSFDLTSIDFSLRRRTACTRDSWPRARWLLREHDSGSGQLHPAVHSLADPMLAVSPVSGHGRWLRVALQASSLTLSSCQAPLRLFWVRVAIARCLLSPA